MLYNKLMVKVANGKFSREDYYNIKKIHSTEQMEKVLRFALHSNSNVIKNIKKTHIPLRLEAILKEPKDIANNLNLRQELIWKVSLIKIYGNEINHFNSMKYKYEVTLFTGDYEKCLDSLAQIKECFGYSLWVLENELLISELSAGINENKTKLSEYRGQIEKENPLALVVASILSLKVEHKLLNSQYLLLSKKNSNAYAKRDETKLFLRAVIEGIDNFDITELENYLNIIDNETIIDMYHSVIKSLQILLFKEGSSYSEIVNECINMLCQINDPLIAQIRKYFNYVSEKTHNVELTKLMVDINNLYTQGRYWEVIDVCEKNIDFYSNCFDIYELYVKSKIYSSSCSEFQELKCACLKDQMLLCLYKSYTKKEMLKVKDEMEILNRILSSTLMNNKFISFIKNKYEPYKNWNYNKIAELSCNYDSIRYYVLYEDKKSKLKFISKYKSDWGKSANILLFEYLFSENEYAKSQVDNIAKSRLEWYDILKLYIAGNKIECIKPLEELLNKNNYDNEDLNIYRREKILYYLFHCYLSNKQYMKAISIFSDMLLKYGNNYIRLDVDNIINFFNDSNNHVLKSSLDNIIIKHFYPYIEKKDIKHDIASFFDEYDIVLPTEIKEIENGFEMDKLIYFLRYICSPMMIEDVYILVCPEIEYSDDFIYNERIEVCKYLSEIDFKNRHLYIEEISLLAQEKLVKKGLEVISRINIDFKTINNNLVNSYSNNLERIKLLKNTETVPAEFYIVGENGETLLKSVLEYNNYQYITACSMLDEYRNEFCFGQYGGLDYSLSTNIRHGILFNHLRKILTEYSLVFTKSNNQYVINNNFKEKYLVDEENKLSLENIFISFSNDFDELCTNMLDNHLQIKSDKKSDGIINIIISVEDYYRFYKHIIDYADLEKIFNWAQNYFTEKLNYELIGMHRYLLSTFKESLFNKLNDLRKDLSDIKKNRLFDNNINLAKTDFYNKINEVKTWLTLNKAPLPKLSFKEVALVSIEVMKTSFSDFEKITIIDQYSDGYIQGSSCRNAIDILRILLHNSYTYGGYSDESRGEAKIIIKVYPHEKEDDLVCIEVKNSLAVGLDRDYVKNRCKLIEQTVKNAAENKEKKVYNHSFEGGSGYLKITSILMYDSDHGGYIKVKVDKNNMFNSKIVFYRG